MLKGNTIELNTAFWFENLTALLELDISDNQITALPVTIGLLTQIQVLRVEGEMRSSATTRLMTRGSRMSQRGDSRACAGNPLRSPPLELVMKGMRDVLFYLQVSPTQNDKMRAKTTKCAIELVENIFP
jgi:hypothetical protein